MKDDEIKVEVVGSEEIEADGFSKFISKVKEFGLKAEQKIEKGIDELAKEYKDWRKGE